MTPKPINILWNTFLKQNNCHCIILFQSGRTFYHQDQPDHANSPHHGVDDDLNVEEGSTQQRSPSTTSTTDPIPIVTHSDHSERENIENDVIIAQAIQVKHGAQEITSH